MNLRNYLRFVIVIIIVIGGVIIIIVPPIPEPICIVCGKGMLKLLGFTQVVLGAIGLAIENKLNNTKLR